MRFTRRTAVQAGCGAILGAAWGRNPAPAAPPDGIALSVFEADITPPLGHPLLYGSKEPAKSVLDRLAARGLVLRGSERPLVICALDWCELRNGAYDQFRQGLADAAHTTRDRVLLTCVHQHDAPYCDSGAQERLDQMGLKNALFDPAFLRKAIQDSAAALTKSLASAEPITHLGVGRAEVRQVASSRRVILEGGKPRFNRLSFTRDAAVRQAPEGLVDPMLKTISFWRDEQPLAALSLYATHPMSYYGQGEVSFDFPGMARTLWQRQQQGVFQIYASGCSGDVVTARYNDGNPAGRLALAERLRDGMAAAWKATQRTPLKTLEFRSVPLDLKPPATGPLAVENLQRVLADSSRSKQERIEAALGLSYQARCAAGQAIDLPVIDFGPAVFMVLPAELFVGYQLDIQQLQPTKTILTAGYGECAPGYIPTDSARLEGFVLEHRYCWVQENVEQSILQAAAAALAIAK